MITVWDDSRFSGSLFAQHLNADGSRYQGWPQTGLRVDTGRGFYDVLDQALPDGGGGVSFGIVSGFPLTRVDVYLQHVQADGSVPPGWPLGGVPVAASNDAEETAGICLDQQGGAYVAYDFYPAVNSNLYYARVQHMTVAGVPAQGWPVGGMPVCSNGARRNDVRTVADDSGGAYVVWRDERNNLISFDADIYAQRFAPDGSPAPGWPAEGLPVCTAPWEQEDPLWLLGDGLGGVYIAWHDYRDQPPGYTYGWDAYLTHLRPDGTLAPGWPANGMPIAVAPNEQSYGDIASDGAGGVYLVWEDARPDAPGVYAQHVLPDGALAPGWPVGGLSVAQLADYLYEPRLCPDAAGGVYVSFAAQNSERARIQHLTSTGQRSPGWPAEGLAGSNFPGSGSRYPRLCSDGHGGVIMVWSEVRSPQGLFEFAIYAQHYAADGATAALGSLVSSQASATAVRLTWMLSPAAAPGAQVERRTATDGWFSVGGVTSQDGDLAVFEDRSVVPGARYAYRLSYLDGGQRDTTPETWVDVPLADRLALAGLRPNPGVGANLAVAFSLPNAAPATLELIDVAGRRVASREVGTLGAGQHLEPLAQGARVAPGLYWLRLTQAGASLVSKAVVAR